MNLQNYLEETGLPDVSIYKDKAKEIITSQKKISAAFLQCRLHIGYIAAVCLLYELEGEGFIRHIISPKSGSFVWELVEKEKK